MIGRLYNCFSPKKPMTFRFWDDTYLFICHEAKRLGIDKTEVVELALKELKDRRSI